MQLMFMVNSTGNYTYFSRTIADIDGNLKKLDETIENLFIPSLFGRNITENERELLSLPVKEGGLGIRRIHQNAKQDYQTSKRITAPLISKIKATGGVSAKILVFSDYCSKFSVLSPPFYGIPKFVSVGADLVDLSGMDEGSGGHFRPFG